MYDSKIISELANNPNVYIDAKTYEEVDESKQYGYRSYWDKEFALIHKLTMERPTWKFYKHPDNYRVDIHDADNVFLGKIWTYNKYYCVTNHRIVAKLDRGEYRYTKNIDKAVTIVLDEFGHPTHIETANAAYRSAYESLNNIHCSLESSKEKATKQLHGIMLEFCRDPEIYKLFMARVKTRPEWDSVLNEYNKYRALLATTYSLRKNATVILREERVENEYIVRHLNQTTVYDDNTLPTEYRDRLDILSKLRMKECCAGVGVRIHKNLFVLAPTPSA